MEYYQREGSDYKELENHSNTLREMHKFTTSTTVISGPTEMLTPAFYKMHLEDTTTISSPDHIYYKSVNNMFNRHYDRTVEFLQELPPKLLEAALGLTMLTIAGVTTTAGGSKKKGVRTTTITADYDVEHRGEAVHEGLTTTTTTRGRALP